MNILIVTEGTKWDVGKGSIGDIIEVITRHMQKIGHQVSIVTRRVSKEPIFEIRDGVRIYRYPSVSPQSKVFFLYPLFSILFAGSTIAKVVRDNNIDLINHHFPFAAFSAEFMSSLNKAIPSVYTFHAPFSKEYAIDARGFALGPLNTIVLRFFRFIERMALSKMDILVTLSNYMAAEAQSLLGSIKIPLVKIPGGVDTTVFNPEYDKSLVRKELGLKPEAFIFFSARRLVRRMGLHNLIAAFKEVVSKRPNSLMLIAGKGHLARQLQEIINENGLMESCKLLGFVDDKALPKFYQACDAFVLPTLSLEGFGMVILEAFATDKPVIGTPVGSIPEILNQFSPRLLTNSTDPGAIAQKMMEVMDRAEDFFPNGCRYVDIVRRMYTWEHLEERYLTLFNSLVANS